MNKLQRSSYSISLLQLLMQIKRNAASNHIFISKTKKCLQYPKNATINTLDAYNILLNTH